MSNRIESTMTSNWFESPIVTMPTREHNNKVKTNVDSSVKTVEPNKKINDKSPKNMLRVQVKRSGGDTIVYSIDKETTGAMMLAKCGQLRGLRQYDYFGLSYVGTDGQSYYAEDGQKIRLSPLLKPADGTIELQLKPMFYPDDIDELIETKLIRLFFDQTRQDLIDGTIQCPDKEMLDLLNSLAARVDDGTAISSRHGMVDYLQVASLLNMFGVEYFRVDNSILLGVHSKGIYVYTNNNRQTPTSSYHWSDIKKMEYRKPNFIIKTKSGDKLMFKAAAEKMAAKLLRLCEGNREMDERRQKGPSRYHLQMRKQANKEMEEVEYWYNLRLNEKVKLEQMITKLRDIQMANFAMFIIYETFLLMNKVATAQTILFYWLMNNIHQQWEQQQQLIRPADDAVEAAEFISDHDNVKNNNEIETIPQRIDKLYKQKPQQTRPSTMIRLSDDITNDQIETVKERINKLFKKK